MINLWTEIKRHLRRPTPLELAAGELVEAELAKLMAESGQEFAASQVAYNTARIARLRKFIAAAMREEVK